jgi:hypothetical protein
MLATKTKIAKVSPQIRINRNSTIEMYLNLARQKYKVLDDNEIIKIWIGKGISQDFEKSEDSLILAKQAATIFSTNEDDQDTKMNYNPQKLKQFS